MKATPFLKSTSTRTIAHLNFVGFRAAVAALEDSTLRGRPFVIAGQSGGRATVLDLSRAALNAGIIPGMALSAAKWLIRDLPVVPPNPAACQKVNKVLETVIARYAPVWQNDGGGNLFLDISGTQKLFGPPVDCLNHVLGEVKQQTGLQTASALAANKLTCKVASRTIRPVGFVDVEPGEEAAFLAHQNIALLPGIGPRIMRTVAVAGFREIGEIAALGDGEALSLFGKNGLLLRDAALGIDDTPVGSGVGKRRIERRADFPEDVIDDDIIRGAIEALVESGGLEMRNEKLGMGSIRLGIRYSDGAEAHGFGKSKRLLVMNGEIMAVSCGIYKKTMNRRIRIRSIYLCFEDLAPLGYQPDLFNLENETRDRRLQEAVDRIKNRFGAGKITKAASMPVYNYAN